MSADELTDRARQVHILTCGEIEIEGRMPWSSNATFLVNVRCGDDTTQAIYKPLRGERPLWDFEPGLHRREVAAYHLSEALALDLVPPTVLRDGPYGEGSLQWFVDVDHRQHYFTIHEERPDLHDTLRDRGVVRRDRQQHRPQERPRADRQLTITSGGSTMACASLPISSCARSCGSSAASRSTRALVDAAQRIAERVPLEVATLLADDEVTAMQKRADWLARNPVFPVDQSGRRYPWPIV